MNDSLRQQNLESAILFMQQEHANTLKGLHEEISVLQKRCSELTSRMLLEHTSISQEDVLKDKADSLAKELRSERHKGEQLQEAVEQKEKRVQMLEQQLKAQERKLQDMKIEERKKIAGSNRELEEKADTIARLMAQLHAVQLERKKLQEKTPRKSSPVVSEDGSPRFIEPTPPKEAAPPKLRRRTSAGSSKSLDIQSAPSIGGARRVPRHHVSGHRIAERADAPEALPDPTPFLNHRESGSMLRKSERTVLPPIKPHAIVLPQKTDSYTFMKKGRAHTVDPHSRSSPEVETLAVGKVTARDNSLRHAQEYNSND